MRKIWKTYAAWLLLGIVFYATFSLISVNLNFSEWHWFARSVYVAGGVSTFIIAYINGL